MSESSYTRNRSATVDSVSVSNRFRNKLAIPNKHSNNINENQTADPAKPPLPPRDYLIPQNSPIPIIEQSPTPTVIQSPQKIENDIEDNSPEENNQNLTNVLPKSNPQNQTNIQKTIPSTSIPPPNKIQQIPTRKPPSRFHIGAQIPWNKGNPSPAPHSTTIPSPLNPISNSSSRHLPNHLNSSSNPSISSVPNFSTKSLAPSNNNSNNTQDFTFTSNSFPRTQSFRGQNTSITNVSSQNSNDLPIADTRNRSFIVAPSNIQTQLDRTVSENIIPKRSSDIFKSEQKKRPEKKSLTQRSFPFMKKKKTREIVVEGPTNVVHQSHIGRTQEGFQVFI